LRKLTFIGFLKQYIRSLSFSETGSLYKLAEEASSDNPRLCEPLFLYALFSGKEKILLSAVKSTELRDEYSSLLELYDKQKMEQELMREDSVLPERYAKVYRSYLCVRNQQRNDAHTKSLMRDRILRLQNEKNVSNYRLYTDLRVNPGNMNAYIKHGDCSKISLKTARNAIDYMEHID
jgi:hypothetical protein